LIAEFGVNPNFTGQSLLPDRCMIIPSLYPQSYHGLIEAPFIHGVFFHPGSKIKVIFENLFIVAANG
jgi:hypothetical protein